ncbi:large neutral amino acids transporter small subunit 2-like isoform X2 [Scyliorhinus canicula]|uniref:large neutral amino acids transporter small subunit 2-like isoform X2 n=1 Tax=Scyliorhinus canicula TaxID=7830 RepID=UPI0018F749A1|nr:large neutral amino acids transporter small subunit 2-like isoform X2 [Scyliorhinus canicula]
MPAKKVLSDPGEIPERVALKKEIGLTSACAIIVGNIIGSGIFISPKGVLEHAGSVGLALIIWMLAGIITVIGSLCYAELGVTIPRSGGDYAYVKSIFGGLPGFLVLWSALLVISPTTQAVMALTFSSYVLQPVFPACVPPYIASRLLAAVCLLLLTWVNCFSVRWVTRIQDFFTAGKLLALALIIVLGLVQICKGHYEFLKLSTAFESQTTPGVGHIALAFLQGSFSYSGWNFLNYVTEELVDPCRNIPRAIFISIPLVTFVYVFSNVAYITAMDPQELLDSGAVAVTFGEKLLGSMPWIMPFSVVLSTFGGINGYLFTSSRLCYSGAREGHLPSLLAMIHMKRCTPIPALLCSVNLLFPVVYLLFWAFLLVFSFYSEPLVCGTALVIILTGIPVYLLGIQWNKKPKYFNDIIESMTISGQKFCFVVFPQEEIPEENGQPLTLNQNRKFHNA